MKLPNFRNDETSFTLFHQNEISPYFVVEDIAEDKSDKRANVILMTLSKCPPKYSNQWRQLMDENKTINDNKTTYELEKMLKSMKKFCDGALSTAAYTTQLTLLRLCSENPNDVATYVDKLNTILVGISTAAERKADPLKSILTSLIIAQLPQSLQPQYMRKLDSINSVDEIIDDLQMISTVSSRGPSADIQISTVRNTNNYNNNSNRTAGQNRGRISFSPANTRNQFSTTQSRTNRSSTTLKFQ